MSCQIIKGSFRVLAHSAGFHDIPRTHSCVCISVKRLLQLFFFNQEGFNHFKMCAGYSDTFFYCRITIGVSMQYIGPQNNHTNFQFILLLKKKLKECACLIKIYTKKDKTGISNFCEFMLGFFVFVIFQLWQIYAEVSR